MANDVSTCVCSLIAAFCSGFDVFKTSRGKSSKKGKRGACNGAQDQELRLSRSLRKGPVEIQREYERNLNSVGMPYAKGDSTAQASLARTLLKLNTGLVGVISSFIHGGSKHSHHDYQSLISLSETSRKEALESLSDLYRRMSQTQLVRLQPKAITSGRSRTPATHPGQRARRPSCQPRGFKTTRPLRTVSSEPTIARIAVGSSEQLAIVRPRNRRQGSSSTEGSQSSSSSRGNTTPALTPSYTTSPASSPGIETPPPQYTALQYPEVQSKPQSAGLRRKPVPTLSPSPSYPVHSWPYPLTPPPIPELSHHASRPPIPAKTPPLPAKTPPVPPKVPSTPRRRDKITPSYYSFASDSTKLGEIPARKWHEPYDYAEMEALNQQALASGWPYAAELSASPKKPGRLRRLFGKKAEE